MLENELWTVIYLWYKKKNLYKGSDSDDILKTILWCSTTFPFEKSKEYINFRTIIGKGIIDTYGFTSEGTSILIYRKKLPDIVNKDEFTQTDLLLAIREIANRPVRINPQPISIF
jgi:hypothetical protein